MLTETKIKSLPKKDKSYQVTDGDGLVIEVQPTGNKFWRLRFRFDGKPAIYTIGKYPAISTQQARKMRDDAKALLAQGIDPREVKKQAKAQRIALALAEAEKAFTFDDAFAEWYAFKMPSWSINYADDIEGRYRLYLKPTLGGMALSEIRTVDCIGALKKIEAIKRLGAMDKVKTILTSLFKYHASLGNIDFSPMATLDGSILQRADKKNFAHITTPKEMQETYQLLARPYKGSDIVHDASLMLALTFLRASELARLRWEYVDIEHGLIRLPAHEMKMNREHLTPLSRQVLAILKRREEQSFGSEFIFHSPTDTSRPMNPESLRKVLRLQGISKDTLTSHGWRHSASTWLHEKNFNHWAIEAQLSHGKGGVHGAYDKSQHLEERIRMMQAWADFLEGTANP